MAQAPGRQRPWLRHPAPSRPTTPSEVPLDVGALGTRTMYRTLGLLYVCGGTVALIWWALPEGSAHGRPTMAAMALLAIAGGTLAATVLARQTSRWVLHTVLALVQVVVAVGFVAGQAPGNDLRFFWAWAAPYAALFFSRRAAVAHAVWVGALMASGLWLLQVPLANAVSLWLFPMATLAATAVLADWAASVMAVGGERLRHMALHDSLTGLPNRRLYREHTNAALLERDEVGGTVVVALLDLNDFKLVNDTYGHESGDELLEQLAARLSHPSIGADVVVRLGGDEFALVVRSTGPLDPGATAARVASVWKAPFLLQDGELWASGSIGLATADRPGATATSLLREADAAMYSAKRVDGGGHAVYDEVMRSSAQARLQLDSALQRGLQEQQLRLHYQPVVDLQTGHWHGAEALVRWQHPERGLVPPDVFIPLAEQTRLIVPMGDWVLREGLRQLACWRRDGVVTADFVLSVNVSPRQLRGGFVDSVRTALRESGVPPACLALELTESVLLGESGELTAMLASLRGLGVGLHLDDFGTGYSPLTHLERVPMDQLKIDRGFTAGLLTSPRKVAVVHAIIAMAAAFDVPVTAEGVEVAEQAHLLRAGGCRYAQGYHYAAAADADETARTLARVPGERRDPAVRLTR